MTKLLVILLIALIIEAIGVVLISRGLKQISAGDQAGFRQIGRVVRLGLTNRLILTGVFLEALFFAAFLYLLSRADVSLIWPLTSLGFIINTLAAKFIGHEHVSPLRWTGVLLIALGAAIVGWSEKRPVPANPPLPPAASDRSSGA